VGFASNQWLNRGQGSRNRGYLPVPARIKAEVSDDDFWSSRDAIVVEVTATNDNYEYQVFHLTKTETEKCAALMLRVCSRKVRERLTIQVLRNMSATQFLKTLMSVLRSRLPREARK
jgi:hypothetical protein